MNKTKLGLLAVVGAGAAALTVASLSGSERQATVAQATTAMAPAAAPASPKLPATADPKAVKPPAAPAAAMPAGPAGKAEVPEMVFDAGTVERGVDIKHDFKIKNVGQHDLTVDAKPG